VFLVGAALTLGGTIYVLRLLPDSLLRLLLWMLTHTLYRIRLEGRDNIPEKGGALLVSNHLSLIDAVLLMASTDRPIRFLIDREWYQKAWLQPFARVLRLIPVSSEQRPRELLRALREAGDAVRSGELVCIFAEGQITRTGNLLPFRRGYERIMKDVDAPIIPVHLDNVWGSIFSFERGKLVWKWPRRVPYPVTVSFGVPLPPSAAPPEVRQAVQELHAEAYRHHRTWLLPLHHSFLRTARRHPFRFAMADARVPQLRFGPALLRTLFLARRLKPLWKDQDAVGILLPPSVGGALVNYAARFLGKVPVNLNYTAPAETLASCATQCGLQTVVTSQAFLERVKIDVPGRTLLLEDVATKPRMTEKLLAFVLTLCPTRLLERVLGHRKARSLDERATIIFSSGSTGHPKGVLLTEFNITANIEQMLQVVHLQERDRLLGILPFFHSFGFTVGLWLPAVAGIGVVYHPNPVEAKAIGGLVRQYRVTLLVATPTFLQTYIRRCAPEDFGSLQLVLAGAEKLPERVATAFEDRFGIRVLEGYGCTECAPVVAINISDFRAAGFRQVGTKRGKIGQPLPGITVRIVDPDSGKPVPLGHQGMLLVRGPNVMQGYLGQEKKTTEVLRDGWYTTGDIAFFDEDGFLEITDRLGRFSKIGGEMVPHLKVEEMLQELAGVDEPVFAVTGVPDERKGERLVVLHALSGERLQQCIAQLSTADLPNLWKPDPRQFFHVEALPYLGTGKLDLRKVRELAHRLSCEA
jgi:acyl-[acyl-carrier-protein]-phospholipid O-acyltransferase/long-chain-fatty-acid--[acyl-carrier-protein] ligase